MSDHSQDNDSPVDLSEVNEAVDGLLREFARTGGPGDDEVLVQSVLKRVSGESVQESTSAGANVGRPERDWPWLFGRQFWKLTAAIAFVFAVGIGGNAWFISQAQADPTEVMLFTRPRFAPGDDATLRVLVRHGRSHQPLANAEVSVVLSGKDSSQHVATVKTDDDGIVDISAELDQELAEGSYQFNVSVTASTGEAAATQKITVARTYRTMVSTDKPLYQPGQTIHMRALSLNVDSMTPAKQRAVEFVVRDGKGNKVFAARPETSDFGIAASDFKLADQVNEGDYQIAVTVGDTTSERTVKVQHYVLPKFRVALKSNRTYYAPGDDVTLTLNADYTFGKPTAGADVRIEVADQVAGRSVFQTVTGKTNAEGLFEANFQLKDRLVGTEANGGDAEVFFLASVTDKTGETNTKSLSRIVAKSPLRIEVFPESGELVPGVENTLYIMTAFPDGTPVQTTVTTHAGTEVTTNEVGIGKVKLTPKRRDLKLTLTARVEATGVTGSAVKNLRMGSATDSVLLRTDRAIYKQGQTAKLTVFSGTPAKRAFVDVIRNGRSLATTAIDLANNKGQYSLDLPADVLGTVQVQAYCVQPSGRIACDTKVIQVRRVDELKVTATLDAETYKPAEQAMVNFLVQSKNGDPVEAALSLAIVDEAVFALNDSRPGLEEMYFLVQEELLKPRYQFITRPGGEFTRGGELEEDQVAEAQVVRFSAAEATDADAPVAVGGEALRARQRTIDESQRENKRSLIRLLSNTPFAVFAILAGIFAIYSITRLGYRARDVGESVASVFRSEMRLLYWMSVVAVAAIPTAVYVLEASGTNNGVLIALALGIVCCVGLSLIVGPIVRIRRLPRILELAPLLRRVIWIVPALYVAMVLLGFGQALAERIDSGAIRHADQSRLLVCGATFFFCLGFVGFLRNVLIQRQTWFAKLVSLCLHQSVPLVLFGGLALSIPSVQQASRDAGFDVNLTGGTMEAFMVDSMAPGGPVLGMDYNFAIDSVLADGGKTQPEPRVRRFFPETLLWQPQLLTDASGKAQLSVPLADSITTWRLAGSAVDVTGRMGSFQDGIRVFQDFFVDIQMPVKLTQNDEISIPISIFNYLNEPQTIVLEASEGDWFEFVDDEPSKSVEAAANEVLRSSFRIRVLKPGRHAMTIKAKGNVLADAVERTVRVEPDGDRQELVANAKLVGEANEVLNIPANAIEGGNDLFVKIYPGGFSQVVEGMDSIFRMPHGCFEQTSSTTYPNVLVLNYLREPGQSNPAIEMKALGYIATGYQRLLSFEVDGGGFDWFGNPPANEVLTAYGLHEFTDMAKVYEVDSEMVARTRQWLLSQMQQDGTWSGQDLRHERANDASSNDRTLRQTAYVLWALARSGDSDQLDASIAFVEQSVSDSEDPYVLALSANALLACRRTQPALNVIARLSDMAEREDDLAWWTSNDVGLTYSYGDGLAVETTALVLQAMLTTNRHPALVTQGLDWIASKRDPNGTWYSTQATVQAMRVLLMSEGGKVTKDTAVQITVNGQQAAPLTITEETGDVFHLVSLTEFVRSGENTVKLTVDNESLLAYQLVGIHYTPRTNEAEPEEKVLQIATNYGQRELDVDDLLTVNVILRYNRPENAAMTLVDLGVPPGFEIEPESFRALVKSGVITKFEPKGPQVSLYFDKIPGGGKPTKFEYKLRAKYPVKAQAPGAVAYQYYEPEVRDEARPELLTVR